MTDYMSATVSLPAPEGPIIVINFIILSFYLMSCHHQSKGSIPCQRWVILQHNVSQITIITHINYISFQPEIEVAGEVQIDLTDELLTPPKPDITSNITFIHR